MREIKFRGYDTELEEMTYFNSDDYILQYGDILRQFIDDYDEFGNPEFNYESVKDKVELMQYTNLKDKNGVEIYEGDIIQHLYENCDKSDYYKVEWDDEELRFCFRNVGNIAAYIALEDMYSDDTGEYEFKVIGNIYDNPELLEIEKEIKLDENFQF